VWRSGLCCRHEVVFVFGSRWFFSDGDLQRVEPGDGAGKKAPIWHSNLCPSDRLLFRQFHHDSGPPEETRAVLFYQDDFTEARRAMLLGAGATVIPSAAVSN